MTKIVAVLVCLVVVIATLKTNGVDGRQYRNNKMDLRALLGLDQVSEEELEEKRTVPQSLIVDYVVTKNTIGANRFDCTHIKHSLQKSGVCILPLPEAIAYCNAERDCGGYGVTTDTAYHTSYDLKDRAPAAELFNGTKTVTNSGWTLFVKQN
ncbi:unnamed protein product [Adineta steineri]|uniref:Uncharacterized protein n=2 Tax=Adineta steineri TaxID=433720 RepID=A0A815IDM6_9BILA|nr:unnamed protein product [Adineta steineri]CAF1110747.1 unnamed protein product [Adineta steineri]CAF1216062.1 unnamed protein product [Adineta steineri]CAF1363622.1 unnamed protein product [Adineta steineri]